MLRLLNGLLTAVAAAVLAALALVLPGGRGLDPRLAAWALGVGLAAGVGAFFHTRAREAFCPRKMSPWAWVMFVAFGLFALRAFCWLVFYADDTMRVSSPNNLGDLSLHMMLARYFANGAAWWPDHPQAAWNTIRYYPGIDLFQSLLLLRGAGEFEALVWVGLLGSAATAAALYLWGGSFTVAGFLFSGGLAGFRFLVGGVFADYQADLGWKSLPLAIFITQRGFLFALPAGLLLMAHWRRKFFPPAPSSAGWPAEQAKTPDGGLLPFWVEALLYLAMPVFHLYAFFFLSLVLGWWGLFYWRRVEVRRHLLILVGVALAPATVQCWLMTGGFTGGHAIHLQPGWMGQGKPFLAFWLANFGLFAPMAVGLWLLRVYRLGQTTFTGEAPEPDESADAFVIPAGLIFFFACVVMLSPWDWDNTKLMIWCYLAALPFLWERWVAPFHWPIRWPICLLLFFSGFVSLVGGLNVSHKGYSLIHRSELDAVQSAVRPLPIAARFAAAPDYNHPLVYCGRKLVMGYEGHLSSQGLDYLPLRRDFTALMLGQPGWEDTAARLGARYLFWGKRESARYPSSSRPWEHARRKVAEGDWGELYDLSAPPDYSPPTTQKSPAPEPDKSD